MLLPKDKLTIAVPREILTDTALENLQKIIADTAKVHTSAVFVTGSSLPSLHSPP